MFAGIGTGQKLYYEILNWNQNRKLTGTETGIEINIIEKKFGLTNTQFFSALSLNKYVYK